MKLAIKDGWHGAIVRRKGQKSHWSCPLHDPFFKDIKFHAERVAIGREKCEGS